MSMLVTRNIKKSFAGRTVLESANLSMRKGEKVGLVGRNGCGKTTLLQVAAGILEADKGERSVAGNPTLGLLAQEIDFQGARTVLEAASRAQRDFNSMERELEQLRESMEQAPPESAELDRLIKHHARLEDQYRLLGGYASRGKVEAVLKGVGFKEGDFSKDPKQLSGGESKRLQLAMILLGGHDLLFLDEPGNHLDVAGTEWLTDFLKDSKASVLIVSHDRYLLEIVVDRIVELEEGRTYEYRGSYEAFVEARELRLSAARKEREAQEQRIARGEEFIRRTFYGQKAKQAKSKRKMLDRIELVGVPKCATRTRFFFNEASTSFEQVLGFHEVGARIDGKVLFEGLDLECGMGETLGVIGPNGSGKTTLLRIIMGLHPPFSGEMFLSPKVEKIYFDQRLEGLEDSWTLLEAMHRTSPFSKEGDLRSHLARFLFRQEEVTKRIKDLSGGERSRALLARCALLKANLLVLDEPTNHLDIFSRESLEQAIRSFRGAAVIVSHDRRLLDGVVDKLLVLGGEKPILHLGDYSSYAEKVKREKIEEGGRKLRDRGRDQARRRARRAPPRVRRKHTYEELEALIIAKEERLEEINREIFTSDVYSDPDKYREREEEAERIKGELEALYEEWDTWA